MLFVILSSCSSTKKTTATQTGSEHIKTSLSVRSNTVPESHTSLAIPVATLNRLPETAAFVKKEGQATASVRFLHDTLFVSATCDSLQALIYDYEMKIEQLRNHSEMMTNKRKTHGNLNWLMILGLIIGGGLFWKRVVSV